MNRKIIVGVSGGIDSTLCALRLQNEGWNVTAVHLSMLDSEIGEERAGLDVLSEIFSIPVIDVDCKKRFESAVIRPFIDAFRRGETPNPCVTCNESLKFRLLIETADSLGIQYIATGHYARMIQCGDKFAVERTSSKKDQTYMLYRLPQAWLERIIFPLAEDIDKTQIRKELVSRAGTVLSGVKESQDICFLQRERLEQFLDSHIPPCERFMGRMLDEKGSVLGSHKGLIYYTEGQRKGLGISNGPWFVVRRDFSSGDLILRHGSEEKISTVTFDRAVWQHEPVQNGNYQVKYCYRFSALPANLAEICGDKGTVRLLHSAGGVSIGQSLVFYDGMRLIGGGIITEMH